MQVNSINPFAVTNYRSFRSQTSTLPLASSAQTQKVNFGRKLEEHRSWGGRINPQNGEVTFKLLTFPNAKKVEVKIFNSEDPEKFEKYPLENKGEGVFETKKPLTEKEAKAGDRYTFLIHKADGTIEEVKDPYALRQGNQTAEAFLKNSILYDQSKYKWQNDEEWQMSPERIKRNPNEGELGVRNANIYEVQIDSFTREGTFDAAKEKLAQIKANGFNTIELMPNENTFSFNWGYDGVDKFAVPEHRGGPDKLKSLIDEAHKQGLNVVMDYVPNHLGPDGAQLKRTGPYIKGSNAFGEAFNFEGENSKYVRDYIVNAGMNWVDNYHVDGLRLDMTKFMESDFTMKEITSEINYHFPDVFLIAEDSREGINVGPEGYWQDSNELHDKRVTEKLTPRETAFNRSEDYHAGQIEKIDKAVKDKDFSILRNLGYDSEWDFKFHHALSDAVFVHNNMEDLVNAIYHSQNAVKYVTSHDETGNMDGTRPVVKYLVPKLNLNSNVILNKDDIQRAKDFAKLKGVSEKSAKKTIACQKAQNVAETLVTKLMTGELEQYRFRSSQELYDGVLKDLDISKNAEITFRRLVSNFRRSVSQHKMALALTYSIPGPKMVFQGDENLNIAPFRFFREFESVKDENYLKTEKGYDYGKAALEASKIEGMQYSGFGLNTMKRFEKLTCDLNRMTAENPALSKGYLVLNEDGSRDAVIHSDVIGLHTKDDKSGDEFFVITNFKNESYPSDAANSYRIHFPEGQWEEVLNTDDIKYGGTGKYSNTNLITGLGITNVEEDKQPIKLGEYSTVYFKRVA